MRNPLVTHVQREVQDQLLEVLYGLNRGVTASRLASQIRFLDVAIGESWYTDIRLRYPARNA